MMLPRMLEYRDRFVYYLTQQINGDACDSPILFPDDTTPLKLVIEISQDEFTRVLSALMAGADLLYPDVAHEVVWSLLRNWECPVSLCDEILDCLQPAFDEINLKLDNLTTTTNIISDVVAAVQQTTENNAAQAPAPIPTNPQDEKCAGATFVVEFMDLTNMQAYNEAEAGAVDNLMEWITQLIASSPLGILPIDELFALANAYFENQVVDYQADFASLKSQMIKDLVCFVEANGDVFDIDSWGDWLLYLGDTYPTNAAAVLFARSAPARQTFLNQIAALINKDASLQSYFDEISTQWFAGTQNPISCGTITCPFTATILADEDLPGTDTGYAVTSGIAYETFATGSWDGGTGTLYNADGQSGEFNPLALMPGEQLYSMLWRVGTSGAWALLGVHNVITPSSNGNIYCIMNDVTGAYSDNSGSIDVLIRPDV